MRRIAVLPSRANVEKKIERKAVDADRRDDQVAVDIDERRAPFERRHPGAMAHERGRAGGVAAKGEVPLVQYR